MFNKSGYLELQCAAFGVALMSLAEICCILAAGLLFN